MKFFDDYFVNPCDRSRRKAKLIWPGSGNIAAKSLIRHQKGRQDSTDGFRVKKWITKRSVPVDIGNLINWSPSLAGFDPLCCRISWKHQPGIKKNQTFRKVEIPPLPHLYPESSPVPVQRANEKHGKRSVAPGGRSHRKVIRFLSNEFIGRSCLVVPHQY